VPNPKYWDKDNVKLGRVTYLPIDDNNTGYNMFLNGECDWGHEVPKDQIDSAKLRDDFQSAPYLGTYYYIFQTQNPPFDDVRIRKALTMAIDRETLVEKVTRSGEFPTTKFVPDNMAGYPGIKGSGEDLAQAKKLLAEAGYPDGNGFPAFEILYNTHEGHKKIAEYVQQQWKENLGLNCTLVNQEWKTYLATRREGDFQVARAGWIGDYQDPNTFLELFVSSSAMNGGKYNNPKYDELIIKAARMPAGKDRMETLMEAERIFIEEDQAVMPIYHYTSKNMIDLNKWGGWYVNLMDHHPTKDIYLK
jgi:oligopeptide transport system substrate-binding protein